MRFADKIENAITQNKSVLCAGFDPQIDQIPAFILELAATQAPENSDGAFIEAALSSFNTLALLALKGTVACIKPNLAFFEQYGLAGLKSFENLCEDARQLGIPVIADAKRGDIGSTAAAYSSAFLGRSSLRGKKSAVFDVDALTINPWLGADTLEVFLKDCLEYEKGLFVLVKTSNPGSPWLQNVSIQNATTVAITIAERVAEWVGSKASSLMGNCGYSGVGAVVGATWPEEAKRLRSLMPSSLFLIPGMGAQGGSAKDAVAGFNSAGKAGLINMSRGLLANFPESIRDAHELTEEIRRRVVEANQQITKALSGA